MSLDERGFDMLPSPGELSEAKAKRIGEKALDFERRIRAAIADKMVRGQNSINLARVFSPRLKDRYGQLQSSLIQQDDDDREVHEELPTAAERQEAWTAARLNAQRAVQEAGWETDLDLDTWTLSWRPAGTEGL